MRKVLFLINLLCTICLISCSSEGKGIDIRKSDSGYKLFIDGRETYIKGIGGTYRLDVARQNGANAFRTWGGSVEEVKKILSLASINQMYVMQGIAMTKDSLLYFDENYKNKVRNEVRLLAETYKNDTCLLAWGIGNEIDLGNANIKEAWCFVEELAQLIKSIDKRHLVSTVISYSPKALELIAEYAPSLDYVGINVYGPVDQVQKVVDASSYRGPFMITEWGPTGWWETTKTEWGAPIEQTSEEKRAVYEERYTEHILPSPRCLGSFVFLWGQKEERTPTWFSMFVEDNVVGLPLQGEKTPMVEAMQRVWTDKPLTQTAPVVISLDINGKSAVDNVYVNVNQNFETRIQVIDKENDKLTYVWEILKEATVLGFGGSYEPRPGRVGSVVVTEKPVAKFFLSEPGAYRLYAYIKDNTGFVSTVNIPFYVK